MNNDIVILIAKIFGGLALLIPLVVALVKYVKKATEEKNWSQLMVLMMNLMAKAEEMFEVGADKKAWVMGELEAVASTLHYEIDWDVISEMIDAIIDATKEINVEVQEAEIEE